MLPPEFALSDLQERWASKRPRQGLGAKRLREILKKQEGRCALSGVEFVFHVNEGTPQKGGRGCHPLYPAVDHMDPGNSDGSFQIVCYALNDLKGHLPPDCFAVLLACEPWKMLMGRWKKQAEKDPTDRAAFAKLLRPNANAREQSSKPVRSSVTN